MLDFTERYKIVATDGDGQVNEVYPVDEHYDDGTTEDFELITKFLHFVFTHQFFLLYAGRFTNGSITLIAEHGHTRRSICLDCQSSLFVDLRDFVSRAIDDNLVLSVEPFYYEIDSV